MFVEILLSFRYYALAVTVNKISKFPVLRKLRILWGDRVALFYFSHSFCQVL